VRQAFPGNQEDQERNQCDKPRTRFGNGSGVTDPLVLAPLGL
jgi:hypothetical protein